MSRVRRRGPVAVAAALLGLLLFGYAPAALAWVDVHVEADEARVTLDRSGRARVEHRLTLKIAGGPLRSLDVRGVDRDAVPEPDAYAVPQREANAKSVVGALAVRAELMPPDPKAADEGMAPLSTLRLRFDDKGLGRGVYVVLVRYRTDLSSRITPDGALLRLAWQGPVWDDGLDSARVTFDLPGAPTEPRAVDEASRGPEGAGAAVTPLVLSTLRRHPGTDELELLRPYVPRGEAVVWALRADARALRPLVVEGPRPPPDAPRSVAGVLTAPAHRSLVLAGGCLLMILYGALVALKARQVRRGARAAGVKERPLVALPLVVRATGAGLALTSGLALEFARESGTAGALLVLVAVLLAAHRTPAWARGAALRPQGTWLPVAEAEAFREPPRPTGASLDVTTRTGKVLLLGLLALLGAGVWATASVSPYHAYLAAFDAVALLAVFCTGRLAELPPDPAVRPVGFLRDTAKRVRRLMGTEAIRVVGRIRMPDGCPEPDELRLGLGPKNPIPGFTALEVGVVYAPGAGGALALPELLLRVVVGSECEQAVERVARFGRSMRGRKPNERVLAFAPRLPTARLTAAIAAALLTRVTRASQPEARPAQRRAA